MTDCNPFDPAAHFNEAERNLDRLEPAWAKAALFFRSSGLWHFGHGENSFRFQSLPAIHQQLDARRTRFEQGDSQELLHAISLCAIENLPMPAWLAQAFVEHFDRFLRSGGPTSLDELFASTRLPSTPTRASQYRRDWAIGVRLWTDVHRVKAAHAGLDPAVRAVLAADKTIGVALTRAKGLVELVDQTQCDLNPACEPLSRFWTKRRKGVR